VIVN
jgi:hypothetical protein